MLTKINQDGNLVAQQVGKTPVNPVPGTLKEWIAQQYGRQYHKG